MRNRIFGYMCINILLTVTLLALFAFYAIGSRAEEQVKTGLKNERVTIVTQTGDVIFDNYAKAEEMDNHLNRSEVIDAINTGRGESKRFSETMSQTTYYYAMKLEDGNILRLSYTADHISSEVQKFIPQLIFAALASLVVAFLAAASLTKKIIKPINNIDLTAPEIDTYDELSPFVREINRQKQLVGEYVASLEKRANTMNDITGNMKEGLILTGPGGEIIFANQSAVKIFRVNEMPGKNILEVSRDVELLHNMKICLSGKNAEMVFTIRGKTYNIFFNPVYENEILNGAVVLFLDITEKFYSEKQRKEFSANVSHELKTPLTTIYGLTEMLINGIAKKEDTKDFAQKISAQTKRLISIVDDIIKLSEFDEDSVKAEKSVFNLKNLAQTVIENLKSKAAGKNVTLNLTGESFEITANEHMIDEMLFNLIDNGINYNTDGGSVNVDLKQGKDFCEIRVSDTGIGIAEEHLSRVFERFYRADKSRSKKTGGTGLGLSIVKHAAEYHKGRVEISSREKEGTTVVCYIAA
ncbi:MAG: histidine kinase [Clostridiales bacterium]|nr:histidine kinase [Clostridiales bacterium]